jgi:hypothetical protein
MNERCVEQARADSLEATSIDNLDSINDDGPGGVSAKDRVICWIRRNPIKILTMLCLTLVFVDSIVFATSHFLKAEIHGLDIQLESNREGYHTPMSFSTSLELQSVLHSAEVYGTSGRTKCVLFSVDTTSDNVVRHWITRVSLSTDVPVPSKKIFKPPRSAEMNIGTGGIQSNQPSTSDQNVLFEFSDSEKSSIRAVVAHPHMYLPEVSCQLDLVVYAFNLIPLPTTLYVSWDAGRGIQTSVLKPSAPWQHYESLGPQHSLKSIIGNITEAFYSESSHGTLQDMFQNGKSIIANLTALTTTRRLSTT